MDVWQYAEVWEREGLDNARRAVDVARLETIKNLVSCESVKQCVDTGCEALRESTANALEGLEGRAMNNKELTIWQDVWTQSIDRQHARLREHLASTRAEYPRVWPDLLVQCEQACQQDLAVFIAKGRDRVRAERNSRRFQRKQVVLTGIVSFLAGVGGASLLRLLG